MIKNWIISIVNKTNNKLLEKLTYQNKKIQELEKSVEELSRRLKYRFDDNRINMLDWKIENPSKYRLGDKVTSPKGIGIVCEKGTMQSCEGGNSYYYFVIVKNRREYFTESELK